MPSYACQYVPNNNPPTANYLAIAELQPGGTTLPDGVAVIGLGPIGMSITATNGSADMSGYAGGTRSAAPWSSATNWEVHANSYVVQLYCNRDLSNSYTAPYLDIPR